MTTGGTVGVCGAGQMGAGTAVVFARAGYTVLLWERAAERVGSVEQAVENFQTWMDQEIGPPHGVGGSLQVVSGLERIESECGVVFEAIEEDLDEKASLLMRLGSGGSGQAVLATMTSGLSITALGRRSGTGPRLAGTHFWNPPHLMPLVEVVAGEETSAEVLEQLTGVIASAGKIPIRVNRDVPGFVGNRLLHALWREAINLVDRGVASPGDIDRVARLTFGLRLPALGPLENMDAVGLDLVARIHDYLLLDLSRAARPQPALAERVRSGDLGMKTGRGFYDWSSRDAGRLTATRDAQIVRQLDFLREVGAL